MKITEPNVSMTASTSSGGLSSMAMLGSGASAAENLNKQYADLKERIAAHAEAVAAASTQSEDKTESLL